MKENQKPWDIKKPVTLESIWQKVRGTSMCVLNIEKDEKRKASQRRIVEGNGLELTLVVTSNFLSLTHMCLVSQDLVLTVWCVCRQHQHHLGTLKMQICGPTPGLFGLRFRKPSFNNPSDEGDAPCNLRHISPGREEGRKSKWTASVQLSFYSNFTFHFVFKGEAQKKYDASDIRKEKRSPFSEDQAETSWKVCTSYEADQLHFQKAGHEDNFASWQWGSAQAMGGDAGKAPASLCVQETAGTPGL